MVYVFVAVVKYMEVFVYICCFVWVDPLFVLQLELIIYFISKQLPIMGWHQLLVCFQLKSFPIQDILWRDTSGISSKIDIKVLRTCNKSLQFIMSSTAFKTCHTLFFTLYPYYSNYDYRFTDCEQMSIKWFFRQDYITHHNS